MKYRVRDARLFRKPSLLVLGAGSVLLPLVVLALLTWNDITAAFARCPADVLKTPAIYIEHTGDSDKPIDPIVIATQPPDGGELCAAIMEPSSRHSTHVYLVNDDELAQSTTILEMHEGNTAGVSEFRYVAVRQGKSFQSGSLDLEHSRKLVTALAAYFAGRRPNLNEQLNQLRRRLGETSLS